MDSPDIILLSGSSPNATDIDTQDTDEVVNKSPSGELGELREQVLANLQKPNVPNVNVQERIIICVDMGYENEDSVYRLGDGTTFTPTDMLKRVLVSFVHSKHAINKKTEFAILVLKEIPYWLHNFTNNIRDIINTIDYLVEEETTKETIEFENLFQILAEEVELPVYDPTQCMMPPPYVVRMIVLYGRSNCIPIIPLEDSFFNYLKKHLYFYIDILLAHEEDCAQHKCEEIYDALQDLDDGYSYVFEVSRNATKIHDCVAKLLAHPLQRPLQKNTDYTFRSRY